MGDGMLGLCAIYKTIVRLPRARPNAVRSEVLAPLQNLPRVLLEMRIAGHGQHVGVPLVRPDQLGALRVAAFEMHSVRLACPRVRFLLVHEVLEREAASALVGEKNNFIVFGIIF